MERKEREKKRMGKKSCDQPVPRAVRSETLPFLLWFLDRPVSDPADIRPLDSAEHLSKSPLIS